MKKKIISMILLSTIVFSGCSSTNANNISTSEGTELKTEKSQEQSEKNADAEADENASNDADDNDTVQEKEESTTSDAKENDEQSEEQAEKTDESLTNSTFLGSEEEIYYDANLKPSIPAYKVNDDFSNVEYDKMFDYKFNPEYTSEYNDPAKLKEMLIKNSFAIVDDNYSEFFDIYESNRYSYFPNFVTVDSLMHTYHIYFAYLMKKTESDYLSEKLQTLSLEMLEKSKKQYDELKGTEYETAALNNLMFFYVGNLLLDDKTEKPIDDKNFDQIVNTEYSKIISAKGIDKCLLTDLNEDYSQYKPRGYYEGDEKMEKYFRTMMWYGRIPFEFEDEDATRSAMLITMAISDNPDDWMSIYNITSFFAGTSDDPGYTILSSILKDSFGKEPQISDLAGNDDAFKKVSEKVKSLDPPKINSIPVMETEENLIPSFRFMGQRFTIDAAIMQRLIYRSVEENSEGEKRYLPDALDVAAVLGSDTAYTIMKDEGATDYKKYEDNLTTMKSYFGGNEPELWNVSLYSGWLNTLRPLLEKKTEGYPSYMLSEEWSRKDLETFVGSYTELKHDTILYAKQVLAEMGSGEDEETPDDRGYVDPEPVVYSRFAFLSKKTKEGLESFGMIDENGKKDLDLLSEMSLKLLEISEKELKNEKLSDDDYEFIRTYGGNLEHFWIEANKENVDEELIYSYQAPCPVVADIATDPNGQVLEVGTGNASTVYVVFPIDGKLHIGSGSVYDFYQFTVPISDRMTDSEWREALENGHFDDDWNWIENTEKPKKPDWTMEYRVK
ncbi:DUF3160 domain-containing protein [Butyrivibrio sp. AE3004]|uniref:DUF3160 domain-containing protein n=1 Tax=Butyrivibrio sp. AE3004 TaxID=1506994 RepID=UPI0006920C6F|nr:DUF3160 domain-containing protein [Butyrivibrio sp. AE3004]